MKLHPNLPEFTDFTEDLASKNLNLWINSGINDAELILLATQTIQYLCESLKSLRQDFIKERFLREQLTIELQKYQEFE